MRGFAANLGWLWPQLPLAGAAEAARAAGFGAVEIIDPYAEGAAAAAAAIEAAGLPLAVMNLPMGEPGAFGCAAVEGAEARFEADLDLAMGYAARLSPGVVHIPAGRARGPAARTRYVGRLRRACALWPGQVFTIEPINDRDVPGYHLATTDEARAVIAEVGAPNLRLQLDLYHAQIMEGDLCRRIAALAPLIAHVQIAGAPRRTEPDRGEVAMPVVLAALAEAGYEGWVGAEYRPTTTAEEGLGWLRAWG